MEFSRDHVPLAWYNNGYGGRDLVHGLPTSHKASSFSQTPSYMASDPLTDQRHIHPALRYLTDRTPTMYAPVRPSLPPLQIPGSEKPLPALPTSPGSSSSSDDDYSRSLASDTGSMISDSSSISSPTSSLCSPRALRRSGRRARGMSLREIRQKQSEADLQRAYTSSVEQYLSGDMFRSLGTWSENDLVGEIRR